jgi:hypothetical protein
VRFAVLTLLLFALTDGATLPVVVAAALLLAVALAVASLPDVRTPSGHLGRTLRERARRRRLPRAFDPDAAGRPRPRAPSLHLA